MEKEAREEERMLLQRMNEADKFKEWEAQEDQVRDGGEGGREDQARAGGREGEGGPGEGWGEGERGEGGPGEGWVGGWEGGPGKGWMEGGKEGGGKEDQMRVVGVWRCFRGHC